MRTIINISLPKELNETVEAAMKRGKFATKSEFFRAMIRLWEENQLVKEVEQSRKEFAAGLGRRLKSLADLD